MTQTLIEAHFNSGKRYYQTGAIVLLVLSLSVTLFLAIGRTGGLVIYPLDDPYIHLAVAEEILKGGYGVNSAESASPSSSILYPFLLAGLLAIGFGDLGPLVLNIIGTCVTAWMVSGVFWSSVVDPRSRWQVLGAILTLPFLLLALNLISLPMTGMEHSLHVMSSVAVIIAMHKLDCRQSPSPLLLGCILLAPLLRFEGIAVAIAALIALLFARRFRAFSTLAIALVLFFTGYFVFMTRLGLPILPSSVLAKSSISEAAVGHDLIHLCKSIVATLSGSLENRGGTLIGTALALLFLSIPFSNKSGRVPWLTIGVASAAIAAHMVAGKYGWFGRYEIYVMSIAVVALLLVWSHALRSNKQWAFFQFLGLITFFALISAPYVLNLYRTPAASENIYAQQYQMHRFAVDFFPKPVAVNDLGYVSYQNENHVLDLWGLGSEAARRMSARGARSAEGVAALTSAAGSIYAMVYYDWFKENIPLEWCHIATLKTPQVTAASGEVEFYLIDKSYKEEMEKALEAFAETLPVVSSVAIYACSNGPDLDAG